MEKPSFQILGPWAASHGRAMLFLVMVWIPIEHAALDLDVSCGKRSTKWNQHKFESRNPISSRFCLGYGLLPDVLILIFAQLKTYVWHGTDPARVGLTTVHSPLQIRPVFVSYFSVSVRRSSPVSAADNLRNHSTCSASAAFSEEAVTFSSKTAPAFSQAMSGPHFELGRICR